MDQEKRRFLLPAETGHGEVLKWYVHENTKPLFMKHTEVCSLQMTGHGMLGYTLLRVRVALFLWSFGRTCTEVYP
jgi:hypothetical protein